MRDGDALRRILCGSIRLGRDIINVVNESPTRIKLTAIGIADHVSVDVPLQVVVPFFRFSAQIGKALLLRLRTAPVFFPHLARIAKDDGIGDV